ncbi:hypothetical protein CSKR_111063 [Clonorchis sinensis]|nr:hypothetical protein CSKR_111063 [Clonorchis sinensis]
MALGSAAANGFIGSIVERYGFIESQLCMLGVFCFTVIFIWILPETGKPLINPVPNDATLVPSNLPVNDRSNVCPTPSDLCANFKSLLSSITSILSTHNPMSILALLVIFSINLVLLPENNYLFLYLMAKPFSWSPEQVGLCNALIAFLMAVLCVCLAGITAWSMKTEPPVMTTDVGSPDQTEPSLMINSEQEEHIALLCADRAHRHQILHNRLKMIINAVLSLLAVVISRTMLGFAFLLPNPSCTVLVLLALFLNMVRSSLMPTLQSFLSSLHDATKQGQLFSLIGVCNYASQLIGLPSLPAVYGLTTGSFPGAVFLLSACISAVSVVFSCVLLYYILKEMRATRIQPYPDVAIQQDSSSSASATI